MLWLPGVSSRCAWRGMQVRKWGGEALFVASLGGQEGRNVRGLRGRRGNRAVFSWVILLWGWVMAALRSGAVLGILGVRWVGYQK